MPHILILNVEVSATFVTQKAEKVELHKLIFQFKRQQSYLNVCICCKFELKFC